MSNWPQYTALALYFLSLGISLGCHGQPRGNHNFLTALLASALGAWILYEGGFWTPLLGGAQ